MTSVHFVLLHMFFLLVRMKVLMKCPHFSPLMHAVSKPAGRSRRWATKALAKQKNPGSKAVPNAFPKVALPWAAALLRDCDVERHGVGLFNRDPLLLGRLLITLVSCIFACSTVMPGYLVPC